MPTSEEPVRIKCGPVKWTGAAFELELAAELVSPSSSGPQVFTVSTSLSVTQGRQTTTLPTASHEVTDQAGAQPDGQGFVPLVPQTIRWDRAGGTISGPVSIQARCSLHDPTGAIVDRDEHTDRRVDLGSAPR